MTGKSTHIDQLIRDLQERAKELNCLYKVEEVLSQTEVPLKDLFVRVIEQLPPGWQYPEICQAEIIFQDAAYRTPGYRETPWKQQAEIQVRGDTVGTISVSYTQEVPKTENGCFLKEETKLIRTIADRIGHAILHRQFKEMSDEWDRVKVHYSGERGDEWSAIVSMLRRTDRKLFIYVSQRMLHYLYWHGIKAANDLLRQFGVSDQRAILDDSNQPIQRGTIEHIMTLCTEVFTIASKHFSNDQIVTFIQKWIQEDKSRFLVRAIDDPNSSIGEIIDAITRYHHSRSEGLELSTPIQKGVRVSLVRRFFSDQLEFINVAKEFIDVDDYYDLIKRVIFPSKSHGKLGGKSAGLFLADHVIKKCGGDDPLLQDIHIPKTWYVTSDALLEFLYYNNLEEVVEQKYKEIDEVHIEYQNIIQMFKISHFPPEIVKGLMSALEDIGDSPIIVRSSSLLEDRLGSAFSGKYKSLFIANQGGKQERLDALMDAIAEIYASTFAPDPIEYRKERGLLDFYEEMGIMIQEVVGSRVGPYYFPTFAGVAFSSNEFRWSARIDREDGLLRIVPGLGTRAVDRLADDYPVLIAPGKPNLRVNVTLDEVIRYAPKFLDVLNLETNQFETLEVDGLLKAYGNEIPNVQQIVSVYKEDHLQKVTSLLNLDFERDAFIVSFEGVFAKTPILKQMQALMALLEEKLQTPVDLEFAHDGQRLYLLQCRAQSYSKENLPSPIPRDIPENRRVFSADRFVSNGQLPDISHIVYVVPDAYFRLADPDTMKRVGRVVGRLNKVLPKRQFILMGPGRWGSRGDIKLGVSVTYADINNTSLLVEIARMKGHYVPDLSFGTHFFQDLVEASIRYLPLYPDDEGIVFNEIFLRGAKNLLPELLPDEADMAETVRVIDVPKNTEGLMLRVLMNADLGEALGFLADPSSRRHESSARVEPVTQAKDDFWQWRYHMAEKVAASLDGKRFGVKAFYVFGSTKNATAGPGSDIDVLLHVDGTKKQREQLLLWLEGWSLTLAEMNFLRTGYRSEGLLDVHLITDEDVENKTSYAVKINAVTDPAKPLPLMGE